MRPGHRTFRLVGVAAVVALMFGAGSPFVLNALGLSAGLSSTAPTSCSNTVESCSTPVSSAGVVTGTVTDGSGTALPGICVYVYPGSGPQPNNNGRPDAITGAGGSYSIDDIAADSYAVEFTGGCGNSGSYGPVWFNQASNEAASSPVVVTVGETTGGINAKMTTPGATIGGTVTNASSTGLQGVCVTVFPSAGNPFQGAVTATTTAGGTYSVANLAAGSYDVEFDPSCYGTLTTAYATQYYNNATTQAAATPVTLIAGQTQTGIGDALAVASSPQQSFGSASVSGTVTASAGGGAAGVCVTLYAVGSSTPLGTFSPPTDGSGNYTISNLGMGSYDVKFDPFCQGSSDPTDAVQWYNGASSQAGATAVDITTSSQVVTGVNATLVASALGGVTGTVSDAGGPITGSPVCVSLYEPGSPVPVTNTSTDPVAGAYAFSGIPVGSYDIEFDPSCGGSFASADAIQWYSGASSQASATPVSVAANVTSTADALLPPGGGFSGSLTVPSGATLFGGSVTAYAAGTSSQVASTFINTFATPPTYSLSSLPAGNYNLQFSVSISTGQAVEWYNQADTQATAQTLSVPSSGGIQTGINAGFGDISGTVTVAGTPTQGVNVALFPAGGSTNSGPVAFTTTGSGGTYDFGLVVPGSYAVSFDYYDSTTNVFYSGQASATVTSGTTANVSPNLTQPPPPAPPSITGTVTNALGSGAFGVCVEAYPAGTSPTSTFTGFAAPDGTYAIYGLTTGSYDVQFDPTCSGANSSGYPVQYYNNVTSPGSATAVPVTSGSTTPGINDQLPSSPTAPPAPPPGATSYQSASSASPPATATNDGTAATGSGTGALTVAQYPSDPVTTTALSGASGEYFDVALSPGNAFTSVTVNDCNLNGGNSLAWFNPTANSGAGAWEPVTGSPGPTYSAGPPPCVSVTLTSSTSPTLAQLTGTIFGVVSIATLPGAPTGLAATPGNNQVALSWSAPASNGGSAITGYNVYRSTTATVQGTLVATTSGTSYTDTGLTNGTTYFYEVTALSAVGEGPASTQVSATPAAVAGLYTALPPVRVMDTRPGTDQGANGPVGPNTTVTLSLSGIVPTTATAVVLNVTGVLPTAGTYVTVYPTGQPTPEASNLNLPSGAITPNLVAVSLGTGQSVTFYNSAGDVNLLADLQGYFAPQAGSLYTPEAPVRIMDTRSGQGATGPVGPGGIVTLTVSTSQVPATATAVVLNVTGVQPTQSTYVSVYPGGESTPLVSNLNLPAEAITPNLVVVPLGPGGTIDFYNSVGDINLLADLQGYYGPAPGGAVTAVQAPTRVMDTRSGQGATGPVGPNSSVTLSLAGKVPANATAVIMNVTGVLPTAGTYISVYPTGVAQPIVSNLNVPTAAITPNLVLVPLGTGQSVTFYNSAGDINLLADLIGYTLPTG